MPPSRDRLRAGLLPALVVLALLASACTAPARSPATADTGRAARCTGAGADFPRSALYYLDQRRLPRVKVLARYDVVVVDHEWEHRVPRSFFRRLRAADPGVCLLAYVNLVDFPDRLGSRGYWANRYRLWQYSAPETSSFPRRWLARTAAGEPVSEWPKTTMANLTVHGPRVDGESYPEYAARWVVDTVWASGLWDGVLLDVWGDRVYTADADAWDSDRDGADEPEDLIYGAGHPWARGLRTAERLLRRALPDAVLVANGDRTLRANRLDGRAWESFVDPRSGRPASADPADYVRVSSAPGGRRPGVALTLNVRRAEPRSPRDRRTARYRLACTLLQDGFWAPMGRHYGKPAYYRVLGPRSLGRGYLGRPRVPDPSWRQLTAPYRGGIGSLARGLFRRDFEHGVVLVNTGTSRRTVPLSRPHRMVHNLKRTASVTLGPRRGVILVRAAP